MGSGSADGGFDPSRHGRCREEGDCPDNHVDHRSAGGDCHKKDRVGSCRYLGGDRRNDDGPRWSSGGGLRIGGRGRASSVAQGKARIGYYPENGDEEE